MSVGIPTFVLGLQSGGPLILSILYAFFLISVVLVPHGIFFSLQ